MHRFVRLSPTLYAATAFALLFGTPLFAQQMPTTPPGAPVAARVVAGTYGVDPDHTQVLFTVNHLGFTTYTGQFTQPTGTLTLDPKNPARDRIDVTFRIDKVATTVPHLNEHLQTADFFDAAKYPEGRFVSRKVAVTGSSATISGDLTLHGVTRPVVLKARFVGAGTGIMGAKKLNVGFSATTSIKRSDFGMSFLVPLVSDRVDLVINAGFEKQ